jgi:hypothetical protein
LLQFLITSKNALMDKVLVLHVCLALTQACANDPAMFGTAV